MEINGVSIGDVFKTGKNISAKVVDFHEVKSLSTGLVVKYICIAQSIGLASNTFEVPFSTVVRYKLANK